MPSGFHVTNSSTSNVEALSRLSARVENVSDDVIVIMFLDVMSDNVSNAEQNSEMLQGSQPNSSRASSDSANSLEYTPTNLWPPVYASVIASGAGDWPISNREQTTSSNTKEWVENMSVGMTLGSNTPGLSTGTDPLGCGVPVFSASNKSFVAPQLLLQEISWESEKQENR